MRQFDFYEFAGVLVPGAVVLTGVALCFPAIRDTVFRADISVGEAALSLIVAYGAGHLVQAAGNGLEKLWWALWGGMPSDWPRSRRHALLAPDQGSQLEAAVREKVLLRLERGLTQLSACDWSAVVRQIYATVLRAGAAQRVDIFNGNYGLNRGLAAALLAILAILLTTHGFAPWQAELLLVLGVVVAVYRMHRFGVHYARELLVQFLAIEVNGGHAPAETKG